jgi:hypothetical protein
MESLEVGDVVYDIEGNPCSVLEKSTVHYNPCYEIKFNTGESIIADHEHKWVINDGDVVSTEEIV